MITSNPEHKKATLKKLIQVGKATIAVTLAGVATTVTIFIHTNIIKKHEFIVQSDIASGTVVSNTWDMVTGEETLHKEFFIDNYKRNLEKNNKQNNEKNEVTLVYDESKTDSDIVELSDKYRECILESLNRRDDVNNPDIKITVSDLKLVFSLSDFDSLQLSQDSDISWLNYCSNLDVLELEISKESDLEVLSQIKGLNVSRLKLSTLGEYEGKGSIIDEKFFSFLKNCPNLNILEIESSAFSINSDFLRKVSAEKGGLHLRLNSLDGSSQKIKIDELESFKSVTFKLSNGNGMYDIPIIFSKEEFNSIFNSKTFTVLGEDGSIIIDEGSLRSTKYEDYIKEINQMYDQIDKIISTMNINEKMSEKEKLSVVLEYVLQNLTYNEASAKIQQEQGIQGSVLGNLNEDLAEESKNSYTDGFLYGVFNENGKPICGNYSALMKTLLTKVGVESYMVGSRYHAYNMVNVDGEYYYVDATFLDNDTIDLDKVIENNSHLIMPGVPEKVYDTTITPSGVDMPEFNVEKRVDQIIFNAKKDYLIKFNNQLYNVSFTMLMSILAGLGLAISKKKLEKIEDKEIFDSLEEDLKLQRLVTDFEWAKDEYDKSNPFKKAYLKLSGKANFKKMQEEIDEVKGIKK